MKFTFAQYGSRTIWLSRLNRDHHPRILNRRQENGNDGVKNVDSTNLRDAIIAKHVINVC